MKVSTKGQGPRGADVRTLRLGAHREPRFGRNKRPMCRHLLYLEARLECPEAGPGRSSESTAFLPAPVLRLTQTQEGGQRRGMFAQPMSPFSLLSA